jgi:predicted RNA-binding Zn ribbon-like protein
MVFNRRNRLKWYLNFISLDMNQLKINELRKLMIELSSMHLFRNLEKAGLLSDMKQKRVIKMKEETFESYGPKSKDSSFTNFADHQKQLREFIYTTLQKSKGGNSGGSIVDSTNEHSISLLIKPDGSGKRDVFRVFEHDANKRIEYLINDFVDCLNGTPVDSFKNCPECNSYFFQPTRREKIYCTNKCASRHIVRRSRKKQKEERIKAVQ